MCEEHNNAPATPGRGETSTVEGDLVETKQVTNVEQSFNKKSRGEVFNTSGPGPDQFRINLETDLNLNRVESKSKWVASRSPSRVSVLTHQRFHGLVADIDSVAWSPSDHYGLAQAGDTREWRNDIWGITIKVRDDLRIEWIRANASRLAHGSSHNGYHVGTQALFERALDRLWTVLLPLCAQDKVPTFRFHTLEVGLVVRAPFSKLESLIAGRNYPRLRKPPMHFQGESIKFGTSPTGSNFSLRLYDKGRQLNDKHSLGLPLDTYTRIEVLLRKDKLRKAFGGDTIEEVTVARMEDVFFDALYKLDSQGQDRRLATFNTRKPGLLAMAMALHDSHPGPKPMEHPSLWWLRSAKNKKNAKGMIEKAQLLAGNWKGERLRDLVPRTVVPQSLPLEIDWDLEEESTTNPAMGS